MRVVFTPRAVRQLERLYGDIAERAGEAVADSYVGRITAACERLDLFPRRGTQRNDILPGLRLIGFEDSATIAFVVMNDEVVIEGVFHGGQDIAGRLAKPKS